MKTATKMNKSEFIRSQPIGTPASVVQKEGAKRGMKFSANFVYTIRAKAKERAKKPNGLKNNPGGGPRKVASSVDALLDAFVQDLRKAIVRELMESIGASG